MRFSFGEHVGLARGAQRGRRALCGWTQYATRWSSCSDSRFGTVAHLTELLEEIVEHEITRKRFPADSEKGLPTEVPELDENGEEVGGGDSSSVASQLVNIIFVAKNPAAFAVIVEI